MLSGAADGALVVDCKLCCRNLQNMQNKGDEFPLYVFVLTVLDCEVCIEPPNGVCQWRVIWKKKVAMALMLVGLPVARIRGNAEKKGGKGVM